MSLETRETVVQRIAEHVASARVEEASRLLVIATRTYDHLDSKGLFRRHGWDLHSVGHSVVDQFKKRLHIEVQHTRGTDGQFTEVPIVDHETSKISAQDEDATTHELGGFTPEERVEILQEYQDATESLLKEEQAIEREREEKEQRGRRSIRSGSEPDLSALANALNVLYEGVDGFNNSWVPPE
jgi:hypothetical protein